MHKDDYDLNISFGALLSKTKGFQDLSLVERHCRTNMLSTKVFVDKSYDLKDNTHRPYVASARNGDMALSSGRFLVTPPGDRNECFMW